MAQKSYYLDTNIWLNLWKKEGDSTKGIPYWQIAKSFIEKVMFSKEDIIIYSGPILKEIKFILNNEVLFKEKLQFLKEEEKFYFIQVIDSDYEFSRKLEDEFNFNISFFDCLHIAICKRMNYILVTRDNELINHAKKYIIADKPENLIS
jgi:hypothetical protein